MGWQSLRHFHFCHGVILKHVLVKECHRAHFLNEQVDARPKCLRGGRSNLYVPTERASDDLCNHRSMPWRL